MIKFLQKFFDSPTFTSWSSVFVRFGSALFVLPLVLKVYTPVEQSFWFFINTIIGFAMLADAGFGSTLVRAVSYFKSGANTIPRNREEYEKKVKIESASPNLEKLKNLLTTSSRIYILLTAFMLLVLSTVGVLVIWNIMTLGNHNFSLWAAYGLVVAFASVSISTVKWSSYTRGLGFISTEARFNLFMGVVQLLGFIIMLSFGLKPVYLVGVMMLTALAKYLYLRAFVQSWFKKASVIIENNFYFDKEIFKSIWGATWRFGGLQWGAFAINSGTSIVISQIKDPVLMASFLFTMRIVHFISNLAKSPFYTNVPKIFELAAKKDYANLRKKASEYIFLGMAVMILGFGSMMLFGNWALGLLTIDSRFLPLGLLLIISLNEFLDNQASFHVTTYISTNHVPFLLPATISGALIVLAGFYVLPIYGLYGVVISQFIIQASFNYWYGLMLSLKLVKWNFWTYLTDLPRYGLQGIVYKINFLRS